MRHAGRVRRACRAGGWIDAQATPQSSRPDRSEREPGPRGQHLRQPDAERNATKGGTDAAPHIVGEAGAGRCGLAVLAQLVEQVAERKERRAAGV